MAKAKILFILTGGTIDSKTEGLERDILLKQSAVPGFIESLDLNKNFEIEYAHACWKDSRDVNDEDRERIAEIIVAHGQNKVIITHGTFTLAQTGKFLKHRMPDTHATIVLTGSLIPLIFENSDGPDNLKFALRQLGNLGPGVYVCMNQTVLDPAEAVKDPISGKFYSAGT
ncbi:MAG: asparaginase [Patescibacteria group bacterium]|nr:asparaginase [Patescibacteria group bacterium]